MNRFGAAAEESSKDLGAFVKDRAAIERFDASQYAFFGNDVHQEELGGLEDDDDAEQLGGGLDDDDYGLSSICDRDEVDHLDVVSDSDNLAELPSSFKLMNTISPESRRSPGIGEFGFDSGEYGSGPDFMREAAGSTWLDQQLVDPDIEDVARKLWPQQQVPRQRALEPPRPLYRHSSYPPQQWSGEPNFLQSPFSSFAPPRSPAPQNQPRHRSSPGQASHMMLSGSPQISHFPGPQHQFGVSPPLMQYGGSLPQYNSSSHLMGGRPPQSPWMNQSNMGPGGILANMVHQQMPQSILHSQAQAMLHQRYPTMQSAVPHFPPVGAPQVFNSYPSPVLNKYSDSLVNSDLRDQRRSHRGGKQNQRHSQQVSDIGRSNSGWPQFRSKYMSSEEIESIVRMQLAATHINDPYVDDYYHQAVQAKKSRGKFHFAPSTLREMPSRTRAAAEPHAYLQVDALGRVPFSSIRRPRPLLEVDSTTTVNGSGETVSEPKSSDRPLEQEPMLAARIVIEDGLCHLLDVDDIDRYFQASQQQLDGGAHLKRRRQMLLEGLAASLHLDGPPKDDFVFMRLVSLPKGRKLVSKYLQLLPPGSDLARIVSMAVFRHLRFLFGGLWADADAAATANGLAKAVASSLSSMDLDGLADCLMSVVQSTESQPPPLRPLGSAAGDGASVVLKSLLERASNILTDPRGHYSEAAHNRWQPYFNFFFGLLTKYCNNKYDSIMQSLMSSIGNSAAISAAASYAMKRELPFELLQTCLPIINDDQRKDLVEFTQRPIPAAGYNSPNRTGGHSNTASVPG